MWVKFYEVDYFPSFAEVTKEKSEDIFEVKVPHSTSFYFNIKVYKQRMKMSLEPYFLDAQKRCEEAGKKGYVQLVGLGLGVWMKTKTQTKWFLEAVAEVIRQNELPNIEDLDLAWIPDPFNKDCDGVVDGETIRDKAGHEITIYFTRKNPADRLEKQENLLIASYAWDGNSLPGNEYWLGMLSASGDPAAACCSTITELQNPHINKILNGDTAKFYG